MRSSKSVGRNLETRKSTRQHVATQELSAAFILKQVRFLQLQEKAEAYNLPSLFILMLLTSTFLSTSPGLRDHTSV